MKRFDIILFSLLTIFFLFGCKKESEETTESIRAFGTVFFAEHGPDKTIDNDRNTLWHGTNDIQIGETDILAYKFESPKSIISLNFYDDHENGYYMGDMKIQVSENSTTGFDGDWITVDSIPDSFIDSDGDFTKEVSIESTSWIRFQMTYYGQAAEGGTPSFFLSEVEFISE